MTRTLAHLTPAIPVRIIARILLYKVAAHHAMAWYAMMATCAPTMRAQTDNVFIHRLFAMTRMPAHRIIAARQWVATILRYKAAAHRAMAWYVTMATRAPTMPAQTDNVFTPRLYATTRMPARRIIAARQQVATILRLYATTKTPAPAMRA